MELHFFTGKQPGFEQAAAIRQAVFVEEQGFHNEFDETDETCLHCVISDGPQPVATCRTLDYRPGGRQPSLPRTASGRSGDERDDEASRSTGRAGS